MRCVKVLVLSALFGFGTSCSNPFSRSKDQTSLPHQPNTACQSVDFSSDSFNAPQLKALLQCLNTDGTLHAIQKWIDSTPDADLEPIADLVQTLVHQDQSAFYSIEQAFRRYQSEQVFSEIETRLSNSVSSLQQAQHLTGALQTIAPEAVAWWFESQNVPAFSDLAPLIESESFVRFLNSEQPLHWWTWLHSRSSLLAWLDLFQQNQIKLSSNAANSLRQSQWLEHAIRSTSLQGFSSSLLRSTQQTVSCFNGSVKSTEVPRRVQQEIAQMSFQRFQNLFSRELRELIITGRGYCQIPVSIDPIFSVTDQLVFSENSDVAFSLIQQLAKDNRFLAVLSDPDFAIAWDSARPLVQDIGFRDLWRTLHFMQHHSSLSLGDPQLYSILSRVLKQWSPQQVEALLSFVRPWVKSGLNNRKDFQNLWFLPYAEALTPSISFKLSQAQRTRLSKSVVRLMQSPLLADALVNASKIASQRGWAPLFDRVFLLFESTSQKGKHPLRPVPSVTSYLKGLKRPPSILTQQTPKLISRTASHLNPCKGISTDRSWIGITDFDSKDWTDWERCFGSMAAAKQWFTQSQSANNTAYQWKAQQGLVNFIFSTHPQKALEVQKQWAHESPPYATRVWLQAAGDSIRSLLKPISRLPALTEWIASSIEQSGFVLSHKVDPRPRVLAQTSRPFNPQNYWDQPQRKQQLLLEVRQLSEQLCPSFTAYQYDCKIDPTQVPLLKNPQALLSALIQEWKDRPQTWIGLLDPRDSKSSNWNFKEVSSEQINFRTHLQGLALDMQSKPVLGTALKNLFGTSGFNSRTLETFIKTSAEEFHVLPLVSVEPLFPEKKSALYSPWVRLHLVNDLDQLELIAVHADFEAFGLTRNYALSFIQSIGQSWGDDQPGSRTLAETANVIQGTLNRFDRSLLHRWGDCRTKPSRCPREWHALSSRISNLRSLLPLFHRFRTRESGGTDGMRVLRNLFFAIESAHPQALSWIPTIARLGLLHQVGKAHIEQNTQVGSSGAWPDSTQVGTDLLSRLSRESQFEAALNRFFQVKTSPRTIDRALLLFLTEYDSIEHLLPALLAWSNETQPQFWVPSFLNSLSRQPDFLLARELGQEPWKRALGTIASNSSAKVFLSWQQGSDSIQKVLLNRWNPRVSQDLDQLLSRLFVDAPSTIVWLVSVFELMKEQTRTGPVFDAAENWLRVLLSAEGRPHRTKIATWLRSPEFQLFCDVYSDAKTWQSTESVLESLQDNGGLRQFVRHCESFLFR